MARHRPQHLRARRASEIRRTRLLIALGTALSLSCLPAVAQAISAPAAPAPQRTAPAVRPLTPAPPTHSPSTVVAPPLRVSVPAAGISTTLVPLGLTPSGELEDLEDFDRAGWYADGPAPGSPGAALVVGHVDSYEGPAVFHRLEKVEPGDVITVTRTGASALRFRVSRVASYDKHRFPTAEVFGTDGRELRLITCFGSFDADRKSYTRNLVVFAGLVAPDPTPSTQPRSRTAHQQREPS